MTHELAVRPKKNFYEDAKEFFENLNSNQAFLEAQWKDFAEWRANIESDKPRFQAQQMKEVDRLIAKMMDEQLLSSDEKSLEYLETEFSYTGAIHKLHQINSIIELFKKNWKDKNKKAAAEK